MKARKIAGVIGVVVFVLLVLNPPWRVTVKNSGGHTQQTYIVTSGLWQDPTPPAAGGRFQSAEIATDVISLQFLALAAVALAVHYLLPKPRE